MIPLEQGSVFRRAEDLDHSRPQTSQSLWNRAVSFDPIERARTYFCNSLNPFGTGQCLST